MTGAAIGITTPQYFSPIVRATTARRRAHRQNISKAEIGFLCEAKLGEDVI